MSEVKRFFSENSGRECVYAADFDRVAAERDAAQGREAALKDDVLTLGCIVDSMGAERDALQQRLTAADERADVLDSRKGDLELSLMWVRSQLTDAAIIRFIDIALKPAEGGGDDS